MKNLFNKTIILLKGTIYASPTVLKVPLNPNRFCVVSNCFGRWKKQAMPTYDGR